ncbi:MAG: PAS domain-containing protein [Alphaproteobacteria bacterium]
MLFDDAMPGLSGQEQVYSAWQVRLHGRDFIAREDISLGDFPRELANVSIVEREADSGFRFRLAGTALRNAFGREARGLRSEDVINCAGKGAWCEGLHRALDLCQPVMGQSPTASGGMHYWMRLPMSSDGITLDLVLCHDWILSAEALVDPEQAARKANRALRIDREELIAA